MDLKIRKVTKMLTYNSMILQQIYVLKQWFLEPKVIHKTLDVLYFNNLCCKTQGCYAQTSDVSFMCSHNAFWLPSFIHWWHQACLNYLTDTYADTKRYNVLLGQTSIVRRQCSTHNRCMTLSGAFWKYHKSKTDSF